MRKGFLRTGMIETETLVDVSTGEIVGSNVTTHKYLANNKEEFFLAYAGLIGVLMNMTQAEVRVFGYCLKYKNTEFDISKKVRMHMSKEVSVNERTILNTLPILIEKGVLLFTDDEMYMLNPRYVFYGSSKDRAGSMKTVIELGYENK